MVTWDHTWYTCEKQHLRVLGLQGKIGLQGLQVRSNLCKCWGAVLMCNISSHVGSMCPVIFSDWCRRHLSVVLVPLYVTRVLLPRSRYPGCDFLEGMALSFQLYYCVHVVARVSLLTKNDPDEAKSKLKPRSRTWCAVKSCIHAKIDGAQFYPSPNITNWFMCPRRAGSWSRSVQYSSLMNLSSV